VDDDVQCGYITITKKETPASDWLIKMIGLGRGIHGSGWSLGSN